MAVISSLVTTFMDKAGNPRTDGWFLTELTSGYIPGGLQVDLTNWFRRIESLQVEQASGLISSFMWAKPNEVDFPGDPASGRVELWRGLSTGSGAVVTASEALSGNAVSGSRVRLHVIGY